MFPQCYSCSRTGTEENHYCLGCAEGAYYKEDDLDAINDGFGKPIAILVMLPVVHVMENFYINL